MKKDSMKELESKTQDERASIEVKEAVLARSGIYIYSKDEMAARGIEMPTDKPFYKEYRPAGVLVSAKDKFALVPVPREHPSVDIDKNNFHTLASGVTGDAIEVVARDDGEVELRGKIAFFSQDAYDYYVSGNKDTSAGYISKVSVVKNPDEVGYDLILQEIKSVNHVAIVSNGRGGKDVRVLDSTNIQKNKSGGFKMKHGFLSFLGIGKSEDDKKFSEHLMSSLEKAKTLDSAKVEEEISAVTKRFAGFGDSEEKELLAGAVADCYKTIDAVLAEKEKVAETIDALFEKCKAKDAEAVANILDACCGKKDAKEEKEKEDEKKDAECEKKEKEEKGGEEKETKDSVDIEAIVNAAVEKALSSVKDSIDAKVDEAMKNALGNGVQNKPEEQKDETKTIDSAVEGDCSFLVRGVFGN